MIDVGNDKDVNQVDDDVARGRFGKEIGEKQGSDQASPIARSIFRDAVLDGSINSILLKVLMHN